MDSVAKAPLTKRINWRIFIFAAVVFLPIGWIVYTFVHLNWTGGIERYGNYSRVDLKAMGNFPFDPINGRMDDVPAVYRQLDGKKVLLIGQMYAGDSSAPTVNQFQLVYSIQNCCFNGPPRVQERVFAHVPNNGRVPVYGDLVKVFGTLHVNLQREAGRIVSVYDMDVEKVEP